MTRSSDLNEAESRQRFIARFLRPDEIALGFVEPRGELRIPFRHLKLSDVLPHRDNVVRLEKDEEDWSGIALTSQRILVIETDTSPIQAVNVRLYETAFENIRTIRWSGLWGILKIDLKSPRLTIDCEVWGNEKQRAKELVRGFVGDQTNRPR